jgi:hypothetical protein
LSDRETGIANSERGIRETVMIMKHWERKDCLVEVDRRGHRLPFAGRERRAYVDIDIVLTLTLAFDGANQRLIVVSCEFQPKPIELNGRTGGR